MQHKEVGDDHMYKKKLESWELERHGEGRGGGRDPGDPESSRQERERGERAWSIVGTRRLGESRASESPRKERVRPCLLDACLRACPATSHVRNRFRGPWGKK